MDIRDDLDAAMKKLPTHDTSRIFWEIITGQIPPGRLHDIALERMPAPETPQ